MNLTRTEKQKTHQDNLYRLDNNTSIIGKIIILVFVSTDLVSQLLSNVLYLFLSSKQKGTIYHFKH
jgi:hypothetical protein